METKVKILKNDRVHIIIKGFEIMPYTSRASTDYINYLLNNSKLTLIFRHIARFDIKDKKLMCLDGNIMIYKLKIVSNELKGSHAGFIKAFNNTIVNSLWSSASKITCSGLQLLNGKIPEIEIIYGYNK